MSRLLFPLVAGLGVSLLAPAATSLLLPGFADAQAADFTGKIKRVRVKKRKTGTGQYRTIVRTTTSGAIPDGVRINLDSMDGDTVDESATATAPVRAAVLTQASLAMVIPDKDASISLRITPLGTDGKALYDAIDVKLVANAAELAEAAFAFNDGTGTVGLSQQAEKSALVEIDLDFESWPERDLDTVKVEVVSADFTLSDKTASATISEADLKWRIDTKTDLEGERLQVHVEALDGTEVAVEGYAMRSLLTDDTLQPITYAKLTETRKENTYAVSAWVGFSDGSDGGSVTMSVESESVTDVALSVKEAREVWRADGITFDDDPAGFTYEVEVGFVDDQKKVYTFPVEVEVPEPGEFLLTPYTGKVTEGAPTVSYVAVFSEDDGETWSAVAYTDLPLTVWTHVMVRHSISFKGPFEGPEPDETEVDLSREVSWRRVRGTFTSKAEDPTFAVSLSAESDLGKETDEVDFSATASVSGFGSGTKKSTTTSQSSLPTLQ